MWGCHLLRCFLAVSVIISPNVTASERAYKSFTAGGFQGALVTTHINKQKRIHLDTSYISVEAPRDFSAPCGQVAHLWLAFTELGFKK